MLCLKPCVVWFVILSPKFTIIRVPLRRRKVWFHITRNMGLCQWKNISWLNIQLLGIDGKMPILFLLQRSNIKKSSKEDLVLIIRPSQTILGILIFIRKMMHNKKKSKEDLFVAKVYMHIFNVKIQWLKCLGMHQNPQVVFPNQKQMVNNMPSFHWCTRPWNNMWCQLWIHVLQQ